MAKGKKDADVILNCISTIRNASDFMVNFIPCIIPQSEEEEEQLMTDWKVLKQLIKFIDECDGDIGYLDEVFDTDKIASEYSKFESTFQHMGDDLDEVT